MSIPKLVHKDGTPMRVVQLSETAKEIYDEAVKELKGGPQNTPAIQKIDNITYKEIISEEELKTYKSTLEWEDNKKYLILYGTGSFFITTGSKEDTDEEIIENYRQSLRSK